MCVRGKRGHDCLLQDDRLDHILLLSLSELVCILYSTSIWNGQIRKSKSHVLIWHPKLLGRDGDGGRCCYTAPEQTLPVCIWRFSCEESVSWEATLLLFGFWPWHDVQGEGRRRGWGEWCLAFSARLLALSTMSVSWPLNQHCVRERLQVGGGIYCHRDIPRNPHTSITVVKNKTRRYVEATIFTTSYCYSLAVLILPLLLE